MKELSQRISLRQFTGSETWYRHRLQPQGAFHRRREARRRRWRRLLASRRNRCVPALREGRCGRGIPGLETDRRANRTATLACEDGNGRTVHSKKIEYTDFPLDQVTLWFSNNTILLPSEY